jgi:hypothetical protein
MVNFKFCTTIIQKKVYVDEVTVTPINNSDYKTKLSIVGKDENKEIEITFGIIKNLTKKIINLIQVNELLIVNMNKTNDGVIYSKNSFILRFFMETSPP